MNAINQKFIMQVRASGIASSAYGANHLTLTNILPLAYLLSIQMKIFCSIGLSMLDKNKIAISFTVACFYYLAVTTCIDRRTSRCGIINPAMGFNFFMYWMFAA